MSEKRFYITDTGLGLNLEEFVSYCNDQTPTQIISKIEVVEK